MSKALSVAKLDMLTVRPYIKSMLLLIPVGLLFGVFNKSMLIIPPMFMVWASLFAGYPFSIGEKNSLEKFLGTTSLKRKSVVTGRYLFSCLSAVSILLLALVMVFVSCAISKTPVEIQAIIFISSFGIFLYAFIISFQIPFYFKLGYLKARTVTFLPLFAIGFIVPVISFIPPDNSIAVFLRGLSKSIEDYPYFSSMVFVCISAVIISISHAVSCKIYINKEL